MSRPRRPSFDQRATGSQSGAAWARLRVGDLQSVSGRHRVCLSTVVIIMFIPYHNIIPTACVAALTLEELRALRVIACADLCDAPPIVNPGDASVNAGD